MHRAGPQQSLLGSKEGLGLSRDTGGLSGSSVCVLGGAGPKTDSCTAALGGQPRSHRGAPGLTPDPGQEEGFWPFSCTHVAHGQAWSRLTLQDGALGLSLSRTQEGRV